MKVFRDQLIELRLDIHNLLGGEFKLVQRDLGLLQVAQEAELVRQQEQQGAPASAIARRTTHTMDVLFGIIGRVELNDPVDGGNVEAACGNVRAQQGALWCVAELEKRVGPLGLLLFAVQIQHRNVDVVQQVGVVLYRLTGGEEDDDLLVHVLLEEGEEQQEARLARTHHVALLQRFDRRGILVFVHFDVHRRLLQGNPRQIVDLLGGCCREQNGLPCRGEQPNDFFHLLLKADLENAVRFVDNQHAKILDSEAIGVLQASSVRN